MKYNTAEEVARLAAALRAIVAAESSVRKPVASPIRAEIPGPDYPRAAAEGVGGAAAALLEEFDGLGDWSERYQYLIELGRKLPDMPIGLKVEANRVRGCQSTVFLSARARPGTVDVVEFLADSDSAIVSGLVALLQRLFSGQPAGEILDFDLPEFLARIGLEKNLTTGRRNGLAEMVERLRGFAARLVARQQAVPIGELEVAVQGAL